MVNEAKDSINSINMDSIVVDSVDTVPTVVDTINAQEVTDRGTEEIMQGLGEILTACGIIEETDGCDKCPIKFNCIDETPVGVFENLVSTDRLSAFLKYAETR